MRGLAAIACASFLTAAGCDSTTPLGQEMGGAGAGGGVAGATASPSGAGGGSGAPSAGGPVTDPGAGGLRAGLQANGSIAYVRNK
jgi:hypothetical protein